MIIRHSISALNAHRSIAEHSQSMAKTSEKLASGKQINKAADGASGLAISEKMRAQIRGLEQAQRNIQDGVSLVDTAEAGLAGIQEQLQRARELTIQAVNDTLTSKEREMIQNEIDQIKMGINDIANSTGFNGVSLLNGTMPVGYIHRLPGENPGNDFENILSLNVSPNGSFDLRTNLGYPGTENDDNQVLIYGGGGNSYPALLVNNSSFSLKSHISQNTIEANGVFNTVSTINNIEVTQTVRIVEDKYEFKYTVKNNSLETQDIGFYFHMDMMLGNDDRAPFVVNDMPVIYEEAFSGERLPENFNVYNSNGNPDIKAAGVIKGSRIIEEPTELRIGQYSDVSNAIRWTDTNEPVGDSGYALLWANRSIPGGGSFEVNTFYGLELPPTIENPSDEILEEGPYDILLQVGANAGDNFRVKLSDVRTSKLEVEDIVIDPFARAMEALDKLDAAIQHVSSERSKYGAYHNRLDFTYSNAANSVQNLTAAESRIRDADMAKEIMNHTKKSVSLQAAQAILAQSNQAPQSVMQLLRQ